MLGGAMNKGRTLRTVGAALAVSAALAACGGGGNGGATDAPSALNPASMVPASSVAYMSVTIKPQGSMKSNLIEAIDQIAGKGSAHRLSADIERSLGKRWGELKPWAGQQMGIALTGLPAKPGSPQAIETDVLAVLPTSDPAAARRFLAKTIKQSWEAWNVVGHYAIVGGKSAVGQAEVTTAKSSLAADPGFKSDMSQLGGDQLLTLYAPLHQLYEQLLPLLQSLPNYSSSTLGAAAKQAPAGSSVALGVSALRNQFRLDVIDHGTPSTNAPASGVASDVSSLPGSSWLALTLGGALTKAGAVSKLAASLSKSLTTIQAAQGVTGSIPSGPLRFIEQDLVPALGPAELSVSGNSSTTLQAGLVMAPVNRRAGARLAAAIKRLVSGLPISAGTVGGRVAVTFGFSNVLQLLHPSSTLAQNATFKQALAQLPAGGKADVYLNFGGIAALAALDPSAAKSSTMTVLQRLGYLIAGGTHSHFRLVLATN